ncbi:hypothetical protein GALMADRAFT_139457 [Galerina marginata CBS 339.88]|uniref:Uncharacterized protein n=1 Tax=Galerina marginata (strain CBS 339.88) TaxID=685588 RepID=A0A067T9G8_GALM3|nr:hypothetical protein GALMADRAFT_139457 [Galerina marginata CBS 339.88]
MGYLTRISKFILLYNFNPLDLQSSVTAFISHTQRASLTEELEKDLLAFDITSICKVMITRHKSWLVLNPFYMSVLVSSLFHALDSKTFGSRNAKGLLTRFANQLESLNDFLLLQLKSTAIDNYLANLMTNLKTRQYSRQSFKRLAIASDQAQYLTLLCQLFYWDFNSSFTSEANLRYAYAVQQCLKFVAKDGENADLKRAFRQFPSISHDQGRLREVHLDCALTLLPLAGYEIHLLQLLAGEFTFPPSFSLAYPEKINMLIAQIDIYVQMYKNVGRIEHTYYNTSTGVMIGHSSLMSTPEQHTPFNSI